MIGAVLAAQIVACAVAIDLPAGTTIPLETVAPVSSRTAAVGDRIDLRVTADVRQEAGIAIPRGSDAVGEVNDVRQKGMMGMAGRLAIRPLYVTVGGVAVRLDGARTAKGTLPAGSVAGLTAATAIGGFYVFTGRSAVMPVGTALTGTVTRAVRVSPGCTAR